MNSLDRVTAREEGGNIEMTNGSMPIPVGEHPNGTIAPTTTTTTTTTTTPTVSSSSSNNNNNNNNNRNDGSMNRMRSTMMSTTPAITLQTSMPPPPRTSSAVSHTTPLSPSSGGGLSATRCITPGSSASPQSPSQDDARRALELVIDYCQLGGMLEAQDYMTIGRLMEKLKINRQGLAGVGHGNAVGNGNGGGGGGVGLGLSVSPNSEQLPGGMIEVRRMDGGGAS